MAIDAFQRPCEVKQIAGLSTRAAKTMEEAFWLVQVGYLNLQLTSLFTESKFRMVLSCLAWTISDIFGCLSGKGP